MQPTLGDADLLQINSSLATNTVTVGSNVYNTAVYAVTALQLLLLGDHRLIYTSTGGIRLGFDAGLQLAGTPATFNITTTTSATTSQLITSGQDTTNTAGATAGSRLDRAGDAIGASGSRTGGAYVIRSGTGATADGNFTIQRGNTTVFSATATATGIGNSTTIIEAPRCLAATSWPCVVARP